MRSNKFLNHLIQLEIRGRVRKLKTWPNKTLHFKWFLQSKIFFIKANIGVLNQLGKEYKNVELFHIDENDKTDKTNDKLNSILHLTKQIESKIRLRLETFNYLKISTQPLYIELSFLSSKFVFVSRIIYFWTKF